jgi:hypothetical protein
LYATSDALHPSEHDQHARRLNNQTWIALRNLSSPRDAVYGWEHAAAQA